MIDLNKFNLLKKEVEKAERDQNKAAGAVEQLRKQLREEFDCDDLKEAETLLAKLEKEGLVLEKDYNKKLVEFEGAFAGRIDE